jgi:hypothetical protein
VTGREQIEASVGQGNRAAALASTSKAGEELLSRHDLTHREKPVMQNAKCKMQN